MPNSNRQQTIWLPTGPTPDDTNISVADWDAVAGQRGQLGIVHEYNERTYQRATNDSRATTPPRRPPGAPAPPAPGPNTLPGPPRATPRGGGVCRPAGRCARCTRGRCR